MGADGSRSPTNLQHLRATARWLSPFYGGLQGRFPCFAPISYHSPQKSSNIRAIYHLDSEVPGNWAESSTELASIIEFWAQCSIKRRTAWFLPLQAYGIRCN